MVRNPQAICIRCGHFKARPLTRCGNCQFLPATPEDTARSLVLSRPFDAGEQLIGLTPPELRAAARQIREGQGYEFDPAMLARVIAHHEAAKAITGRRLLVDALRWLGPPLALLALLLWLVMRK